jgi:Tol biopolymer transport system component
MTNTCAWLRRRSLAYPCILTLLTIAAGTNAAAPPTPLIDLPHAYYYQEMYVPQLTSGPSSLAWSPDSRELVYSMAGSLWRQRVDSDGTEQLTDGPGYAYQPDWSPDGRFIVYTCDAGTRLELWMLDLQSKRAHQLTHDSAVALEPRWSPDGTRIVYVSTAHTRHFHLFLAEIRDGQITSSVQLTQDNKSSLPRYYYSAFDHEINPAWARDGKSVFFVSNRGRIHGTGGIWRMPAAPGAVATELRYEETNWRARPDESPDGKRVLYSSYLGRNTLQLWLMPAQGGEPFPLTYGDWDETDARWSPDGQLIAAISNRAGNTQLRLYRFPGGASRELPTRQRQFLQPMGAIHLVVRDAHGRLTPARVSIGDAQGRSYAPRSAWMQHAEFDRGEHPFEARYFHSSGEDLIEVPAGQINVEVMKGLTRAPVHLTLQVARGQTVEAAATMPVDPWHDGVGHLYASADVHVHMNYGGHYRNTPAHLLLQAQAEDLDIVENLIVNKEQRIPDIAFAGRGVDPASADGALIVHGQEFHTSYWGHLGLLAIQGNILLPGYAGYPNTAAASLFPTNAAVADLAHAQGALVGYVHPFEEPPLPLSKPTHTDADELPVDVALGKVDYMEVVGFSDHKATAEVWYRLLNLGFRIPAAGGTDAMADYATLRGPVGLNRVYASVGRGSLEHQQWLDSLRSGRSFATNGPLLDLILGGQGLGDTVAVDRPGPVTFAARMRSIVPVEHAQLVCNGRVVKELPLKAARTEVDVRGEIGIKQSGWCVLRAFTSVAEYPVLDNFVYATTSPIYLSVRGQPLHSAEDARYFAAWVEHLAQRTAQYPDWNSAEEREQTLHALDVARQAYLALQ